MNTHPVFNKDRKNHWPNNKPEYYGQLIEELVDSDTEVNTATSRISIYSDEGVGKKVLVFTHEKEAQAFLSFLQNMDLKCLDTLRNMEFSFN